MNLSDVQESPAQAGAAAGSARPLIRIHRVGMIYAADSGPVEALRDISLSVQQGEFVALVGPSGCGKSTLMRIIAGLRPVTSGEVEVDGVKVVGPVSRRRHGVPGGGAAEVANACSTTCCCRPSCRG